MARFAIDSYRVVLLICPRSLFRTFLFALTVLACLLASARMLSAQQPPPVQVTQAVDEAVRTVLQGNVHPLARSEFDRGEAPADLPLKRMLLVLKRSPQQEVALLHLIEDQQYKNSSDYHHWLTPAEFGTRFAPADADVDAVTNWLRVSGFEVSQVSNGRTLIEFSGDAALVKRAFRTSIHKFVVNGEQHWANVGDPTIPKALVPVVAGIDSLNNFQKKSQNSFVGNYSETTKQLAPVDPNFSFLFGSFMSYAVAPYDFATIYDLLPLWNMTPRPINGSGQTIAIAGRTDIDPTDATEWWSLFGLDGVHAPQPTLIRTYNGPNPGINGDETEADIDTQWSGAVAPGATINLVISESTESSDGVDLSAAYIVDNNLASIMNVSYSQCELGLGTGGVAFFGSLWEQAAAEGISVFVSSGDNGAAGCDDPSAPAKNGLHVNGLASTPFNAAVGGTDFDEYKKWSTYWNSSNDPITQLSAKAYIPETSWNDSCTNGLFQFLPGGSTNAEANCNNPAFSASLVSAGGSGGQSLAWLKPTWQTGTPNDNARDLPDVSLFASNGFLNSFYVVCQKDVTSGLCALTNLAAVGGTSVASPAFAGIMALVNQKAGSSQGIPNPVLYKLAAKHAAVFHDVPSGTTIAMPCAKGSANCTTNEQGDSFGVLAGFSTAAGYDLATGLGSVDGANLVNNWSTVTFIPSTTALSLNAGNPVNVKHGSVVPVGITLHPNAATGNVALLVSPGTPGNPGITAFTLNSGVVNGATGMLPGGTYSVIAHYAGDTNYGGSYSNSVPVEVTPENSKTFPNLVTLNINGSPINFAATSATYGAGYFLFRVDVGDSNATVSPSSGISSTCSKHLSSCPTGTVALTANGTPLNGAALSLNNAAYAEDQSLAAGTYSVSAAYPGDASYGPSTGTASFTIAKARTTASAGVAGSPVQYGNFEQIDAGIATTSMGVAPTGTFQFLVDGLPVGGAVPVYESGPYNPNGNPKYAWADASSSTEFLSVGNHTLAVQYSGDGNYAAGTSPPVKVAVTQAQPFFNSYGWTTYNQPVFLNQTVTTEADLFGSYAGAAPTGTITFFDNNTAITGKVTYTPNGGSLSATLPYTFTTPGNHSLNIKYSGDAHYLPATLDAEYSVNVLGPVSVTPAGTVTVPSAGQSGATTLAISPNKGFSGSVSLSCSVDPKAKESSCGFTNGSTSGPTLQVKVNGSSINVSFNLTTTAAHQLSQGKVPSFVGTTRLLASMVFLFVPVVRRRRAILLGVLALVLALTFGACGGGGSRANGGGNTDPGTSPGTYTFTVVAVTGSGPSAISLSTPVAVSIE